MATGLSIANIRQQYSIPANISDSEVIQFAKDSNIQIDFSGSQSSNKTKANQGSNPFSNDALSSALSGSKSAAPSGSSTVMTTPALNGNTSGSVFGNGFNNNLSGNIDGFTFERTTAPLAAQQSVPVDTTTFANWKRKEDLKTQGKGSNFEIRVDSVLQDITGGNQSLIASREVKNGKCTVTLTDGRIVEIGMQKGDEGFDASLTRSDVSYKIFNNGNVITIDNDGNKTERKAVNGETGYVKDGESFDERLARFYEGYDSETTPIEKKQELAKQYIEKYLKGKSDKVQIGDFKKLLRNTPPDSEMGRALVQYATALNDSVINDAIKEVYGTRLNDDAVSAVTDELTREGGAIENLQNPEVQRAVIDSASGHVITSENASNFAGMSQRIIPENQTHAVQAGYNNIKDDELRKVYHDEVSNGIAKYDKSNTMDIANVVLENDDKDHTGAQNMADHAHETDAEIQQELAQLLMDLQVDSVSGKIASHAYEYDISNRDDIIQMIKDHGTEGAKQILEEAKQQYEEQAEQAKMMADAKRDEAERQKQAEANNSDAQNTDQNNTPVKNKPKNQTTKTSDNTKPQSEIVRNSSMSPFTPLATLSTVREMMKNSNVGQFVTSEEFKSINLKDKVEIIKTLSSSDKKVAVKSLVENSEGLQLQGYMYSAMKNDIIKYLVLNSSPKNIAKLQFLEKFISAEDKKFIKDLKEEQILRGQIQKTDEPKKMHLFGFEK